MKRNLEQQLMEAAGKGDTETVALLLDRGANIHADNDYSLQYAAGNGHTKTVALLLDRGANIHAANDYSLQWAANTGKTETVALLLDRGANIHAANDLPLQWAAKYGHTETVALLLKRYTTKEVKKWTKSTLGKPSKRALKPLVEKEYSKRLALAEKIQKIRDSEPEINL
jgi:ankyrin repeat protein